MWAAPGEAKGKGVFFVIYLKHQLIQISNTLQSTAWFAAAVELPIDQFATTLIFASELLADRADMCSLMTDILCLVSDDSAEDRQQSFCQKFSLNRCQKT